MSAMTKHNVPELRDAVHRPNRSLMYRGSTRRPVKIVDHPAFRNRPHNRREPHPVDALRLSVLSVKRTFHE